MSISWNRLKTINSRGYILLHNSNTFHFFCCGLPFRFRRGVGLLTDGVMVFIVP